MIKDIAQEIINSVHEEYDDSEEWKTDITVPNINTESGMRDAIDNEVNGLDFTIYDEDAREVVADGIIEGTIDDDAIRVGSSADTGDQTLICYLATEAVLSKCYELADCEL